MCLVLVLKNWGHFEYIRVSIAHILPKLWYVSRIAARFTAVPSPFGRVLCVNLGHGRPCAVVPLVCNPDQPGLHPLNHRNNTSLICPFFKIFGPDPKLGPKFRNPPRHRIPHSRFIWKTYLLHFFPKITCLPPAPRRCVHQSKN